MKALCKSGPVTAVRTMDSEVTIVLTCRNQADAIAIRVKQAVRFLHDHRIPGEVLIADARSTDGSGAIAKALGAHVLTLPQRNYGAVLLSAAAAARGRYLIVGDAGDRYEFERLMPLVATLRRGAELVFDQRARPEAKPATAPPRRPWLRGPAQGFVGWLLSVTPIRGPHCGLRGFRRDAIERLGLTVPALAFASDMLVEAALAGLDVREVPRMPPLAAAPEALGLAGAGDQLFRRIAQPSARLRPN